MKLTVINSNSKGNAYILHNSDEALLLECGVRFERIKQALNFNLSKVVGCLVTHEHQDHCKGVKEAMSSSIDVYASFGTHEAMGTLQSHRSRVMETGKQYVIGNFTVIAFDTKHDCKQPLGFLIYHKECGTTVFLTDTYYSEYTFKNLNNVIVEANYCETILEKKLQDGASPKFLRDRVIESHMSLQTCKDLLAANDLSQVCNVVLIHLSDGNSDAKRFKYEVEQQTGKMVHIAEPNMEIDFNTAAF